MSDTPRTAVVIPKLHIERVTKERDDALNESDSYKTAWEKVSAEYQGVLLEVRKLTDQIDLNRDEFLRIMSALQSYNLECDESFRQEIIGICDRSQRVITQNVPVIEQRNHWESRVNELKKELSEAREAMDEQAKLQLNGHQIGSYWKLEQDRDDLKCRLEKAAADMSTIRSQLKATERHLTVAREERDEAKGAFRVALDDYDRASAERDQLRSQLESSQAECERLRKENQQLSSHIDWLTKDRDSYQRRLLEATYREDMGH